MNPEQIKDLQRQLQMQGLYTGKIDGVLGPETKAAADVMRARQDRTAEQERQRLTAEAEAKTAEARARETELQNQRQTAEHAPGRQAWEAAKLGVPILGGMYGGHRMAAGVETRQLASEAAGRLPANQSVMRRFAPYGVRAGAYFLPEGIAMRQWVAPQIENETGRELAQAGGTGLIAAGGGLAAEGLYNALTPQAPEGAPQGPALPSPSSPPQTQIPNRERLRTAAETAVGGKVKSDAGKIAHYNMMKKALTADNLPDVAESLGLARNADRASVLQHARGISKLPGRSAILLPLAAAGAAYELAGHPARAEDGSVSEPSTGGKLAAAGTAGAATYGYRALPQIAKTAMGIGGEMSAPMAISDMTDVFTPEHEAMAKNTEARQFPPWARGMIPGVENAYQMAQVPQPNPARTPPFAPPMMRAAALNVPTDIPPGATERANVESGMHPPAPPPMFPAPRGLPPGADQDVVRAWRRSPRATAIELARSSGLAPEDIATLAGVEPDEVHSVMGTIPRQALQARAAR